MFADLVSAIVQVVQFIWPLRIVNQWERGLYTIFGRIKWEVGPGIYPVVPWFCEVHEIPTSWDYVESGRLDLTLKDGRLLSCEAIAKMRVVELQKAWVAFHDYEVDRRKMLKAVVSELLQEADPERFEPGRRGRLLGSSLLKAVQDGAAPIGVECESVRVTTFVLGARTYRLLTEHAASF